MELAIRAISAEGRHPTSKVASVRSSMSESPSAPLLSRLDRARNAFRDGDLQVTAKLSSEVITAADKLAHHPEALAIAGSAQVLIGHVADAVGDAAAAEAAFRTAIGLLQDAHDVVWASGHHVADLGIAMVLSGSPNAEAPLRRAIELGEDTVTVRRYLGLCLLGNDCLAEAKDLLAEVVRRVPTDWRAHRGLATIAEKDAPAIDAAGLWLTTAVVASEAGRVAEALAAYRTSDQLAPSLDAKRGAAAALSQLNMFTEAERFAAEVLAVDPDDYQARVVHLESRLGLERFAEAADAAYELVRTRPEDPVPQAYLGMALSALGKHDEAIVALGRANKLRPDSSPVRIQLANALRASDKVHEAIRVLDDGITQHPDDIDLRLSRVALTAGADLDAAAAQVAAIADLDPSRAPWLWLSQVMATRGDFQQALHAVDRALANRPDDLAAVGLRGAILVDLGELDEGIEALRASIDQQPTVASMANLAQALLRRGDEDDLRQAEEFARRLVDLEKDKPRGAILLARALLALHRPAEAIEVLNDAADRFPPDAALEKLRMYVLLDLDRVPQAVQAGQRASALAPEDAGVHAQLGRIFRDLADADDQAGDQYISSAIDALARAIDLDPGDFDTMALLGRLHLRRNELDRAESLLTEATRLREAAGAETDPALLAALGRVWLYRGKPEDALNAVEEALRLDTACHSALVTKGEALYALDKYAESVEALEQALHTIEQKAYVLATLGESYRMLGKLDKAYEALTAALELEPDDAYALASRGAVNYALENPQGAESDLRAAIAQSPSYRFALEFYRQIFLDRGQLADVLLTWQAAVDNAPEDVELRVQYAETLYLAGRSSDGLEHIEQVLRDEPTHVEALRVSGRILLDLRRIDEAAAQFERALGEDPDSGDLAIDLANARDLQGQPLAALRTIQAALDRSRTVPLLVDYGWRLSRLAAWDEAIDCGRQGVERDPTSPAPYQLLSWALPLIGAHEESLAAATNAVRFDPEERWNHKQRGNTLWSVGRTDEAMEEYTWVADRADLVADNDKKGLHILGWSLMCLGQHERAATCLTKARELGFDELSVLFDFGVNSLAAGQMAEALDTYAEAMSMIARARTGRRNANAETALLQRGSIAMAIYDLQSSVTGGRLESSGEIDALVAELTRKLEALSLSLPGE